MLKHTIITKITMRLQEMIKETTISSQRPSDLLSKDFNRPLSLTMLDFLTGLNLTKIANQPSNSTKTYVEQRCEQLAIILSQRKMLIERICKIKKTCLDCQSSKITNKLCEL